MGHIYRRLAALALAGASLYAAWSEADLSLTRSLLRWAVNDVYGDGLPTRVSLALRTASLLYYPASEDSPQDIVLVPHAPLTLPPSSDTTLTFPENGVPSQTVQVLNPKGFMPCGAVYVKNSSGKTLTEDMLSGAFAAQLSEGSPQVLILHTHGSESYTPAPGESYVTTGDYRTSDTRYNVVRVGDEVAATLSAHGLSVIHDRILYDDPLYDGAYARSAEAIEAYLEKYPSLTYILDIHRDAVEDSNGTQYKLITAEDDTLAQVSFIMGSNHEGWEENLKLAVAVGDAMAQKSPTVMRPITLRSSNYNQHLSLGAMLVEIGTAGNSLDEALHAARVFAEGFAQTVLP